MVDVARFRGYSESIGPARGLHTLHKPSSPISSRFLFRAFSQFMGTREPLRFHRDINHRFRCGVATMAMSRARFPRKDSTRNAHLLSITPQRGGFPVLLFAGSHSIPSFLVASGHSSPRITLRRRKFLSIPHQRSPIPRPPVVWCSFLFLFLLSLVICPASPGVGGWL